MTRKKVSPRADQTKDWIASNFWIPTANNLTFSNSNETKINTNEVPNSETFRSPLYKAKRNSHRQLFKDSDTRDTNWVIDMNSQIQSDNAPNPMNDIFDKEEINKKCSFTDTYSNKENVAYSYNTEKRETKTNAIWFFVALSMLMHWESTNIGAV